MARARYKGENLYRTRITTDIPAISPAGNPLDVFQFDVVQAPTESKGWVFVDFTDTDNRDLIYYHAKSGNTLSYYRKDRDLLNNGSIAVMHPANDFVQINDVSQWIDYTFANLEDFGKVIDMGTNNAIIYGGYIWYNGNFVNIPDTGLNALADGTWYAVFDYTDGTIKFTASLVGFVGLRFATVSLAGGDIVSITDTRGIEGHTSFDPTFFVYNSGVLSIVDGSIGTAQIADNSITDAKLTNSGTSAGTYGDANNYPVVTVNEKGRVTNMSTLPLPTLLYAYVHTQGVAATTWNINHNLNTTDLVFAVFDATDAAIVPDTFVIVDANNVTITFTGAIDGKAVLTVVGGSLAGAPARGDIVGTLSDQLDLQAALNAQQPLLVSGTNIKTINGATLLGAGDIVIGGGFWTTVPGTPTRSSDTVFTITDTSNANLYDQLLQRGTIIKRTQSGTKQAMVVSATYAANAVTVTIIGDTFAVGFSDVKYGLEKARMHKFAMAGTIGTTGTNIANTVMVECPVKIYGADFWAGTAGNGTTTVDINKGGTTMFTVKPSILTTNQNILGVTADTGTTATTGDYLTLDVDAVAGTTKIIDAYVNLYYMPLYMANLT